MSNRIVNTVKEQFEKQAKDFSNKSLTLNKESYLQWIVESLDLSVEMEVLDVAAGTGILSRAVAPFVNKVTSIDVTEHMIQEGIRQNRLADIHNIEFQSADAEQMPFQHNQFDLVMSRLAVHHFANPAKVIQEMHRVCKLNGTLCIIDMISSESDELSRLYNHYERLRDPSHTEALKQSQFMQLFEQTGLSDIQAETIEVPVSVQRWLELTKTEEKLANEIQQTIVEEINTGNVLTGLSPFIVDGEIMFKQHWIKIMGSKM